MSKPAVIVALDLPTQKEADQFLSLWDGKEKPFIKVGYQLFYQVGPTWVQRRKEEGYSLFLDLKLHDIPHTVAKGIESLSQLGIDLLTIHAAGGQEMLRRAKESSIQHRGPKLLAVTQLTSTNQTILNQEIGIAGTVSDCVDRYAELAYATGIDGVIASGQEAQSIRQRTDQNFLIVTPGIRPASAERQDQKRVVTPAKAIQSGADYLVIGRPLLQSDQPVSTYQAIQQEIEKVGKNHHVEY